MSGDAHVRKIHVCGFDGCLKEFSKPSRLDQHIRTHTGERPYLCPDSNCGKKYARSAHLNRHLQQVHAEIRSPRCSCTVAGCGETFASKQNLQKHQQRKHDRSQWKCNVEGCEQSFRKHHQLKAHLYHHQGLLPFQCTKEGCQKKFKQKSHLERHLKIHEGYRCAEESCSEIFNRWSDLRKHKAAVHRADAKCGECNKSFATQRWLKKHKETHCSQRIKYICPHDNCQRAYTETRNLAAHIRSCHENQKFVCKHCGKLFSTKQKCGQHEKLIHDPCAAVRPKYKRLNLHRKTSFASKVTGIRDGAVPLLPHINEDHSDKNLSCDSLGEDTFTQKGDNNNTMSQINEDFSVTCGRESVDAETEILQSKIVETAGENVPTSSSTTCHGQIIQTVEQGYDSDVSVQHSPNSDDTEAKTFVEFDISSKQPLVVELAVDLADGKFGTNKNHKIQITFENNDILEGCGISFEEENDGLKLTGETAYVTSKSCNEIENPAAEGIGTSISSPDEGYCLKHVTSKDLMKSGTNYKLQDVAKETMGTEMECSSFSSPNKCDRLELSCKPAALETEGLPVLEDSCGVKALLFAPDCERDETRPTNEIIYDTNKPCCEDVSVFVQY